MARAGSGSSLSITVFMLTPLEGDLTTGGKIVLTTGAKHGDDTAIAINKVTQSDVKNVIRHRT